jgi:hypothetical protein
MKRKYVFLAGAVVAIVVILFAALQLNGMKEQDKKPHEETQVEQNKVDKAAKTFYVKDYGAIVDDGRDDRAAIEAAIRDALAAGAGAKVLFEPGEYRITPATREVGTWVFRYTNVSGLTLQGDRTHLLFTDPFVSGFAFIDSQDVRIKGFAADYETPPFVQGVIMATDKQSGTVEYNADEGYPLFDDGRLKDKSLSVYGWVVDPDNPAMVKRTLRNTNLKLDSWEKIGERTYRLKTVPYVKNQNLYDPGQMEAGDRYVIGMRSASKPFIFLNRVNRAEITDMTIYASPGGGISGPNSSGLVFRKLQIMIKPGSGRLRSTNADGLHLQNNRVGAIVEDCLFEGSGDDFINMYYSPHTVRQVMDDLRLTMTKQSAIPKPGDMLQIFDPIEGVIRGEAKVAEIRSAGQLYEVKLASPVKGMRAGETSETADQVTNLDADAAGFQIRNNIFRNGRRHGVLLKAHDGVVEGNKFEHLYGSAIAIHNEPDWPEGPMSTDIAIRNNTAEDCVQEGYVDKEFNAVIEIVGKKLNNGLAATKGMRRIELTGNRIVGAALHAISVASAEQIVLRENTIVGPGGAVAAAIYERTVQGKVLRELASSPVYVQNVQDMTIAGLQVNDRREGLAAAVLTGPDTSGLQVEGSRLEMAPGVPELKR